MLPILNLYEMTLNNIPYVLHEHSLTFEMLPQLWSYARPELIFVTNIMNCIHGKKIVMWKNFSFPCMKIENFSTWQIFSPRI